MFNFSAMDKFRCWKSAAMILIFILAIVPSPLATGSNTWQKPGCHKVGHTRKISIPNCVEFPITTNACRGYCESWAVPSPADTVMINPHQRITSVGQCCNIMDTENNLFLIALSRKKKKKKKRQRRLVTGKENAKGKEETSGLRRELRVYNILLFTGGVNSFTPLTPERLRTLAQIPFSVHS
ncbi:hypothetical protein ACI65C_010015 [Semiaphis heraclei]